jgi:hypothetical protein
VRERDASVFIRRHEAYALAPARKHTLYAGVYRLYETCTIVGISISTFCGTSWVIDGTYTRPPFS